MRSSMGQVTDLIEAGRLDGSADIHALCEAAYDDLKALAHARLRSSGAQPLLNTTALVNESYLKLAAQGTLSFDNRAQFFLYASRVMRAVIVDAIRQQGRARHGAGVQHMTLDSGVPDAAEQPIRVDEALSRLEALDPRLARVVEMRYFAGMTEADIAGLMNLTERTVRRDWVKARALLRTMIEP
ncbi:MAG: ECF-type sigma factor [Panacagrimonas sp.]